MNMEKNFNELIDAIKKSRDKCPWVKEQTLEKQRDESLAEAKEVSKAIDEKDYKNLKEELGDLFWDTLMLAYMAEEKSYFKASDCFDSITEKMKRRKPYVFGKLKVKNKDEAMEICQKPPILINIRRFEHYSNHHRWVACGF